MSEIEDEIRQRLIAERQQQLIDEQQRQQQVLSHQRAQSNGSLHADQALLNRPADGSAIGKQTQTQPLQEQPQSASPYYAAPQPLPPKAGLLHRWRAKGGILGGIASVLIATFKFIAPVLALLSKLKFLAFALKFLVTGGSMLVSMWAYSHIFGWPLAVGVVALIFIHECGHAFAARLSGFKYGFMLFVPLMGAFVTMKGYGKSIVTDAFIGIMGPVVGSLAALACALVYFPTHNPFWLALAQWGFFVNLFNLLPTPPLDGGWIVPLFSPKLLLIGVVIGFAVGFLNPLIWVLLVFSIPRIISGWKADPKTQPFYQVSAADKWKYGAAYLGLAAFLALGEWAIHAFLVPGHPAVM